jgi:hypothetical protein
MVNLLPPRADFGQGAMEFTVEKELDIWPARVEFVLYSPTEKELKTGSS